VVAALGLLGWGELSSFLQAVIPNMHTTLIEKIKSLIFWLILFKGLILKQTCKKIRINIRSVYK
jgi:hypothetical protein